MYKAIILVIASEDIPETNHRLRDHDLPLYPVFKKIYEQYINIHPDYKFFFVYGDYIQFEPQAHDLIYPDIKEQLAHPCMLAKTLRAMKYIDENYDYDFLIRTNLSTFWDLEQLTLRLNQLPKTHCLTGTSCYRNHLHRHINQYINYHWISGFDLVASRDLVQATLPYHDLMLSNTFRPIMDLEDYALTTAMKQWGDVNILDEQWGETDVILTDKSAKLTIEYPNTTQYPILNQPINRYNGDHYRCKGMNSTRKKDHLTQIQLLKTIYNIDFKI